MTQAQFTSNPRAGPAGESVSVSTMATTSNAAMTMAGIELEWLPNEVLHQIFQALDVQTLLTLSTLNNRVRQLAQIVLARRFEEVRDLRVRIYIEQENRWRFTIDMRLVRHDVVSGLMSFVPVKTVACRVYSSALLRRPALYKIALVGRETATVAGHHYHHPGQFIFRPVALAIKQYGSHHRDNLLPPSSSSASSSKPWTFDYSVLSTPPGYVKQRSGERWLRPEKLELPVTAFFTSKPTSSFLSILQHCGVRTDKAKVSPATLGPKDGKKLTFNFAILSPSGSTDDDDDDGDDDEFFSASYCFPPNSSRSNCSIMVSNSPPM